MSDDEIVDYGDPEVNAMAECHECLSRLDEAAQERVLTYLRDRFSAEQKDMAELTEASQAAAR